MKTAHAARRLVRVLGATALAGALGCATTPEEKPAGWDTAVEADRPVKREPSTPEEFQAEAASYMSSVECELAARNRLASNKKSAARLMKACITRADFTSMLVLTQAPWTGLKYTTADYPILLDFCMRRGGLSVAEDFTALGVPTEPWEMFRQLPTEQQTPDQVLELKVLVLEQHTRPDGRVEAKARVYGSGSQSAYTESFPHGRAFGQWWWRETKEVKPIGSVVILRAAQPLPTDRRVHILARFDAPATTSLRKVNAAKDAKMTDAEVMAAQKIDDRDPREEAVLNLMLFDAQKSGSVDLPTAAPGQ